MQKLTMKLLREKLNLSQRQIADKLKITDQTVSNWETGTTHPRLTPKQTLELCQLLQISLERLVEVLEEQSINN
jgi:transcriptional regulator with XRE-family HTH domain